MIWTFRQSLATPSTAVLESVSKSRGAMAFPGGDAIQQIVLMDDCVEFAAGRPAHVVVPHLPCRRLTFRWAGEALAAELEDGFWIGGWPGGDGGQRTLHLPDRLRISNDLPEAARFARARFGHYVPEEFFLELRDPYCKKTG